MKRSSIETCQVRPLLAALLAVLFGCSPARLRAPMTPGEDAAFAATSAVELPGITDDPPEPYAIRPGDVLRLRVAGVEPLEVPELIVDDTGIIHVPGAGDVAVGGLEMPGAEALVNQAVRTQDRFAEASLSVARPDGHRATVTGAVDRPGVFEVRPGQRLADLLALSGGAKQVELSGEIVELADLAGARLVRDGKALPVSFARALAADPKHNVRVRSGDVVYVPATRGQRISVLGEVRAAKVVPFRSGMRLTEALAMAGGTTKDADEADIRVVRGPLDGPRVYQADLAALFAGEATDVELAPGDIVLVTEHWFASTSDVVNRLTPMLAAGAVVATLSRP